MTRPEAGLIPAVAPLGDNSLKPVRFDRCNTAGEQPFHGSHVQQRTFKLRGDMLVKRGFAFVERVIESAPSAEHRQVTKTKYTSVPSTDW